MNDQDIVRLPSGKCFHANRGIIGIAADMEIYGGYDEHISGIESFKRQKENYTANPSLFDPPRLSKEDLISLANYMIHSWTCFRTKMESLP